MNYIIWLSYDGTRYDGWQKQGNTEKTIQGKLETVLTRMVGLPEDTPVTVIGAMNGEKPTWTLVAHVGIIGHDRLLVSLAAPHFINQAIKEMKKLSINLVDQALLPKADYVGSVSGAKVDKSAVFPYSLTETGAPIIDSSPLAVDCTVVDIYETPHFESFICSIDGTYVEEKHLNEAGKVDYRTLKPILFEFPTYEYLATGEVLGKCLSFKENREG